MLTSFFYQSGPILEFQSSPIRQSYQEDGRWKWILFAMIFYGCPGLFQGHFNMIAGEILINQITQYVHSGSIIYGIFYWGSYCHGWIMNGFVGDWFQCTRNIWLWLASEHGKAGPMCVWWDSILWAGVSTLYWVWLFFQWSTMFTVQLCLETLELLLALYYIGT